HENWLYSNNKLILRVMTERLKQVLPWTEAYLGCAGVVKTGTEIVLHNGISSEAFNWEPWWINTFTRVANENGLPPNLILGALTIVFTAALFDGARRISPKTP
ncbi:MAG: hypothetical protein Q7R44_00840, partial [bacterium]|nr:hypothetical protein [bacterium]